jgi:hypothetical protein
VAALVTGLSMALAAPALAAEPPFVTNIIPRFGTPAGGESVTITGANFTGATAVSFGGTAASFTVNSSTMITAVSPPGGEGTTVKVAVSTPAGTSETFFHYRKSCQDGHAPAVTSVEPHSGLVGARVTIKGERFSEGVCTPAEGFSIERVFFGAREATSFERVKEGELVAVAPPAAGTTDVTVESVLGQSPVTPSDQFTYALPLIYHWYKSNAKMAEGTVAPIVMFGGKTNLSQQLVGEVNCKTVLGGTVENPVGGGAGVGHTNAMAFYECKQETCEREVLAKTGLEGRERTMTANLPSSSSEPAFPGWHDELEESVVAGVSSVREKIGEPWETFKTPSPPGMLRETEICEVAPTKEVVGSFNYEGELKPEIGVAKTANLNGTKAAVPSRMKFNGASTGPLHSETGGEGTDSGELKYLGYNEQEVMTVKQ